MKKMDEDYRDKQEFLSKLNENYDQIRQINSGGGGIIYAGIHRRLQQKVVLKKIRTDRISIIGSEREMQILMNLKHTYLPRILDFWSYEDEVYTVMEFIEGRSFHELLQEGRGFAEKDVIKWTRQLAEVLEYLHNSPEHIIHSDIKPANLMLTPQNNICLIDFNVSVLQGGEDDTIGYSPSYSPIEQLIQKDLSGRRMQQRRAEHGLKYENSDQDDRTYKQTQDDDKTLVGDLDCTEIDDDKTLVGAEDCTEIDEDKTEVSSDFENEVSDDNVSKNIAQEKERTKKKEKKEEKKSSLQSRRPSVDELVKKYGDGMRVDERSDIYSACATMYHILTGRRPEACYEKQVDIEELLPNVNDAFAYILMHGMEPHPKKRYQNATQLLTALKQLMKSTKKYKRLLLRQDIVMILMVGLFLCSAGAAYVGFGIRNEEILDERLKSANQYYNQRQYEEAIIYLEDNVFENKLYQESPKISQGYYLSGSCYLEQEQYEEAIVEYRKAILLDSSQPDYYRDYGIALARGGELEQARECLAQASAKGLQDDSILLLRGEIASLESDYASAVTYLQECLNSSSDDYVKLAAGLKLDEVLEFEYGEEAFPDRIVLLETLHGDIAEDKKLMVLERMVQVYNDYGQLTKDAKYTEAALNAIEEIISSGYGTLVEWLDKAVFLQSLGRYEEAESCLLEADELYPQNYLIYKRLAFLEIDIQASREASLRDYHDFEEYYIKCDELYKFNGSMGEVDMEMKYLYQVYDEIVVKGWLE